MNARMSPAREPIAAARRQFRPGLSLSLSLGLLLLGASYEAQAQPALRWELQVIEQGQTVDDFSDTTTLGQAQTEKASHPSRHAVACPLPGAASATGAGTPLDFNLSRTITLSPVHIAADEVSFAIDTRETLEDPSTLSRQIDCAALPEPRVVTASHPGLQVKTDGSWSTWQIIDHDPQLSYRLKAVVAHP